MLFELLWKPSHLQLKNIANLQIFHSRHAKIKLHKFHCSINQRNCRTSCFVRSQATLNELRCFLWLFCFKSIERNIVNISGLNSIGIRSAFEKSKLPFWKCALHHELHFDVKVLPLVWKQKKMTLKKGRFGALLYKSDMHFFLVWVGCK